MSREIKDANALTVADLKAFPVWEYLNDDDEKYGEMAVRPVKRTPVDNLEGRLVGIQVKLANGAEVWALIGNVATSNPRLTQHFVTLSVFRDGQCLTLARYHDVGADKRGPQALAAFLGLTIDEVFPISYDVSRFSKGDPAALAGRIEKEPREKLTRAQLIKLSVSRAEP
jgi:hypothetical protein